ncbi:MAG: hypothetical protein ABEN55_15510 [Bradymonadaceae bacterium]
MSNASDNPQGWPTSNREEMLEALAEVLRGIPGVQYVDRQDIQPEKMVSEGQLPAIIVDEEKATYRWEDRHGERSMKVNSGLVLDLQAYAERRSDGAGYSTSTVRELFVARVLHELAHEPELVVQLADENKAQQHAQDVAVEFDVRYPRVSPPKCRALVTIQAFHYEVFDDRQRTAWEKIVTEIAPPEDDTPPDAESAL